MGTEPRSRSLLTPKSPENDEIRSRPVDWRPAAAPRLLLLLATLAACSGDDDTAPSTSATSLPPPIETIAGETAPPPVGLDQLGAGLLGAGDVGVPDTWAIRDLDPAIMDPVLEAEADPFQGLVSCPAGALRGTGTWLQRTFRAPEDPLDNGLLSIDLIIEAEDDATAEAGRAALAACAPVGPDTAVEVLEVQLTVAGETTTSATPAGDPVTATQVLVSSGPSADVPYPSVAAAVTARRNGRTVTIVLAGLDLGVPLADLAEDLVGRLLARLG